MAEQEELKIDVTRMRALGSKLRAKFTEYDKARQSTEEQWLKNVRQFIGEYDPKVLQMLESEQSRAYPRITRVKVLSIVARLHALLFPAGEKNWGIEASPQPMLPSDKLADILLRWTAENPEAVATQQEIDRVVKIAANDIAKHMEMVINDQLADAEANGTGDYQEMVRDVIFSAALYGCGVLKGPMTIEETGAMIIVDEAGAPRVVEGPMYRPYFEPVSVWDYYPDFSAKSFAQMDGQFQRHIYAKHTVSGLAEREDYMGEAINEYLRNKPDGNYQKKNYEQQLDSISDDKLQTQPGESNKYELLEFWGCISGHDLRAAGVEIADSDLAKDAYACVWMIDNTIIKVAQNPYPAGVSMYHQFVFEKDEVNLLGSGLPAIMRDSQLGVSSFTRMLVDNAAAVCGPNLEVDAEQLASSVNPNTVRPFKAWVKDSASPNGSRAVQNVSFDSHIPELVQAINLMREFADTETFVSPMTGGDFENAPSEALRTSGNMSMALASAALPFKDIVRNFDRFTKSVIHALVQWNLIYNARRSELQGDLRPIPRGASSLMAKEVRAVALDQLASTLTPEEMVYINEEELLKERLQVRDLPLDRLMASEDEVKRRKDAAAQQAQAAQQQQEQMFNAQLRNATTDSLKNVAQAQKNMDSGDAIVFKALMEAIEKGANIEELQRIAQRPDAGAEDRAAPQSTVQ
jgi:hypothetical protein